MDVLFRKRPIAYLKIPYLKNCRTEGTKIDLHMKTKLKTCGSKWAKKIKELPEKIILGEPKKLSRKVQNLSTNAIIVNRQFHQIMKLLVEFELLILHLVYVSKGG